MNFGAALGGLAKRGPDSACVPRILPWSDIRIIPVGRGHAGKGAGRGAGRGAGSGGRPGP